MSTIQKKEIDMTPNTYLSYYICIYLLTACRISVSMVSTQKKKKIKWCIHVFRISSSTTKQQYQFLNWLWFTNRIAKQLFSMYLNFKLPNILNLTRTFYFAVIDSKIICHNWKHYIIISLNIFGKLKIIEYPNILLQK